MENEKLKPCPFCGGEAEIVYLHDVHGHAIPLDAGREDIENYKQTAQRFLVNFVAAALGVERGK